MKTLLMLKFILLSFPYICKAENLPFKQKNKFVSLKNLEKPIENKREYKKQKILFAQAASTRRQNRERRRNATREPQYKNCKYLRTVPTRNTETPQSKAFRQKLQKQVIGQVEARIFRTEILRNCVTENKTYFIQKEIDWSIMERVCKKEKNKLRTEIKKLWPKMRINLALISPAVKEDRILSDSSTWLDSTPSHLLSGFNDLPALTEEEKIKAKKKYVETLAKIPLEKFTPSEFKQRMYQKKPLHSPLSVKNYLTSKDKFRLKQAVEDLQKKAKNSYSEAMNEMEFPILGYLNTGHPSVRELGRAFLKVKLGLKDLLKKVKKPKASMGLLLSFNPLVEEILIKNKGYCLVAEQARIQAENEEHITNLGMLGAGFAATAPCFIAGPWAGLSCLFAGMLVGVTGYKQAQTTTKDAFGRFLTGKEFETIASLKAKEKEEFLAKVFLPLGAWGSTGAMAKATSKATQAARATKPGKSFFSPESLAKRKKLGEKSLRRNLSDKEVEALEKAHRVGLGEKGKDGTPARIGNYTEAQKREKYKILRQAGFSKEESKKLMQDGVAGIKNWFHHSKLKPGEVSIQPDGSNKLIVEFMQSNGTLKKKTIGIGGEVSIPGAGMFPNSRNAHRINAKIAAVNGNQVKVAVKDFTGEIRYKNFHVDDLDLGMSGNLSDFGFLKDDMVSYFDGSDVDVKIVEIINNNKVSIAIPIRGGRQRIQTVSIDELYRRPDTVQPGDKVSFLRSNGKRWNGTVANLKNRGRGAEVHFIDENGDRATKTVDIQNVRTPLKHQQRRETEERARAEENRRRQQQEQARRQQQEQARRQQQEQARRQQQEQARRQQQEQARRQQQEQARRQQQEQARRQERARAEENRKRQEADYIRRIYIYDESPYKLLSIPPNIPQGKIQQAYRRQAQKWHPDRNTSPNATKMFQKIKAAYDLLKDTSSRRMYDELYPAYQ